MRDILAIPFGWALHFLYNVNIGYLLSLIIITLVVRLALLPTSIKQQKNSAKQMRLQAKVNKIRAKYAGNNSRENQMKISEETQELYKREGFNASQAGCLPLVITLVVMMGLYGVIYAPISKVLAVNKNDLAVIKAAYYVSTTDEDRYTKAEAALADAGIVLPDGWSAKDIAFENPEAPATEATATDAADEKDSKKSKNSKSNDYRVELDILAKIETVTAIIEGDEFLRTTMKDTGVLSDIVTFKNDFRIGNVDLTATPGEEKTVELILIPVFAGISALLTSLYTYLKQRKTNPEMAKNPAMGCMTFMSPVISIMFAWNLPAGIGFYWIISGVLSFIQTVVLGAWLKPATVIAGQMIDETVQRRAREKSVKERNAILAKHNNEN